MMNLSLPLNLNRALFSAPVQQAASVMPFPQGPQSKDVLALKFSGVTKGLTSPMLSLDEFTQKVETKVAAALKKVDKGDTTGKINAIADLTEVLDLFLQDKWTEAVQPGKKAVILSNLKKLMGPRGQGNIIMAQLNPTAGKLEENAKKIMAYIDAAEQIGADSVVFPEMSLMGYPIRDIIKRHPFIVEENVKWLNEIAKRTKNTRAIVGFVEPRKMDAANAAKGEKVIGKEFYNAMAVLGDGKIEGLVRKSLLPTYGEFNDDRTFEASPASGTQPPETLGSAAWGFQEKASSGNLSEINGHKYGLSICEDTWNDKEFMNNPYYENDPIEELAKNKPEVLMNISASPTRSRKEQMKHAMLSHIAQRYGIPYVYVNQVGAIDESSFDGSSRVYDAQGKIVGRAKSFQEQFMVVNPLKGEGKLHPLPKGLETTLGSKKEFNPYDTSDLGRTYETIVQGIRDYFKKTGFEKAVLGLSGGLDSAVVATLLVDALGADKVKGFSMPYGPITSDQSKIDADELAANLGIQIIEIPITEAVDTTWRAFQEGLGKVSPDWARGKKTATFQNIQARIRAIMLWSMANALEKTFTIATSDKSELYLGYATINGDMSGAFSPISDLLKTKARLLAKWMNENREVKNAIPESTITKPSGAELEKDPITGKPITAESDNMPYEFEDEIIFRIENYGQSKSQMMNEQFFWEKNYVLPPEQKKQWMDKFFNKMSAAIYKWWIFPPTVIVEGNGTITKTEYHHPITARVNWDTQSSQDMGAALDKVITTPIAR